MNYYTSGGLRGENSAIRKAIARRASRANRIIVHMVGSASPVTGTTAGVICTIDVAGTRVAGTSVTAGVTTTVTAGGTTTVITGGTTVFCDLTACGTAGDANALKNKPLRITIETRIILSFTVTPFKHTKCRGKNPMIVIYITRNTIKCYPPNQSSPLFRDNELTLQLSSKHVPQQRIDLIPIRREDLCAL